ncbi:MAG TPA: deoxyribonuclease IV [Thermomicrobiales bacterium]|nr:deoxyribonuclease IV [Thermomicrobiales bacterium]
MLKLGAHMSIAGGFDKAVQRAHSVESDALQIFTKNQKQWKAKPILDEDVTLFRQHCLDCVIDPVVAHDSYLINLASPDDEMWEKSIDAFRIELERCEQMGIPFLVTHPGAHMKSGTEAGVARVVAALDRIHVDLPGYKVKTLLETTAGQGTTLGATFEELAALIAGVAAPERVAVCYDTCHTFVAGYDIRTPEAYAETMSKFDRIIGVERIEAFHFNDALTEIGSKRDRHAHIGAGYIGAEGFRNFMNDPRFAGKPALLETEKGEDLAEDREALILLRSLVDGAGGGSAAAAPAVATPAG